MRYLHLTFLLVLLLSVTSTSKAQSNPSAISEKLSGEWVMTSQDKIVIIEEGVTAWESPLSVSCGVAFEGTVSLSFKDAIPLDEENRFKYEHHTNSVCGKIKMMINLQFDKNRAEGTLVLKDAEDNILKTQTISGTRS